MKDRSVAAVLAFMDAINSRNVDKLCAQMTEDHRFRRWARKYDEGTRVHAQRLDRLLSIVSRLPGFARRDSGSGKLAAVFGSAQGAYAPKGQLAEENRWSASAAWMAIAKDNLIQEWRVYADSQAARKIMGARNP